MPQVSGKALAAHEMRFENFDLAAPHGAIELRGLGHAWDLHNFATFQGFAFHPELDELTMEWQVEPGQENPWGSRENSARGCRLRFSGLRFLRGTSRDRAYPLKESRTVSGISKATPEQGEHRLKHDWGPDERFHLIIQFQDEREFEVAADVVRLEAII